MIKYIDKTEDYVMAIIDFRLINYAFNNIGPRQKIHAPSGRKIDAIWHITSASFDFDK